MRLETKSYLFLLVLAVIYDVMFTVPPLLLHFGINADILYKFFRPVCDQMDSRSFHLFGYKLAVCSRCASIYYGATLGIVLYPFFKPLKDVEIPNLLFLAIPLAALVADFSLDYIDIGHNTFLSRSVTGGVFGISLAFFVVPVWVSLFRELKTKRLVQNE
ncbi:MAG: DUF2085 domain-containing protein [Bacteroidetes bacterium]|nr:DUF2085 domain-containing protein [Bacteroidota bacterium]MCL5268791.1 DUF2085 domain-containing protein [Bacteroidota bacterium]